MEILLAVFTGMTLELLTGCCHGGRETDGSVKEVMIASSGFFCMYVN
jgi:hypothetical protein